VRKWQSAGPHRCERRELLWGVKVWRRITLIIPGGKANGEAPHAL